ncbi:MAG: DNA-methyltransferase [Candidatus Hermodarchaeota archaeon]
MTSTILHGDTYSCLEELEDNSIAVAITSPPYWKQRDYGYEGQIGQERTSEEYIGRLVAVYDKLKDKLRNDGIFFLNIGDKYLSQYGKSHLLQIPYRLAHHMVKNEWCLEDIIIWYKPNHMPSPVKDRFTNTYEPVLVFVKNKNNIYQKKLKTVVKIPLQQTSWKHTAVFPEMLVEEMLNRVELKDGDVVLDPFAGTGTVAVVVNRWRTKPDLASIMIDKGDEFINIIQKRAGIEEVEKVEDIKYDWKPVQEENLLKGEIQEICTERSGEVFIAQKSEEFLAALNGITTLKFKTFHREDALFFFGIENWSLKNLYAISRIFPEGYVLRNMLVISDDETWYPVFMFAQNSTRVAYNFYLDRVRIDPKTIDDRDWLKENFVGVRVSDISGKKSKEGWIVEIIEKYSDGFPKSVIVHWNGNASLEFIAHPDEDELLMERLVFKCPNCNEIIKESYDPVGTNVCLSCATSLWEKTDSVPLIEEPVEVKEACNILKEKDIVGKVFDIKQFEEIKTTTSKFATLERINWGASPGARKLMLGEYFTKMRLYRINQPTVARYLTILRKARGMTVQNIVDKLPRTYKHTVGHWFRTDFGGSIPIPEDISLLKDVLKSNNSLFRILERTTLKFQTVKPSIKGKNPGDFLENINQKNLRTYLETLYVPSHQYSRTIKLKFT